MDKIPKIIHYCWFGRGLKSKSVFECIESWKRILPDYEIIEWNESNFDISQNAYVQEAYNEKKWAFVSDYVRLYALYNFGGIYLDTDVELIKNIDCFLIFSNFMGLEDKSRIMTAVIGSEKGSAWIKYLLDDYSNRSFYKNNGSLDLMTNVERVTLLAKKQGFMEINDKTSSFKNVIVFSTEYFSPKSPLSGKVNKTSNTYCIHHFESSWINKGYKDILRKYIVLVMGEKNYIRLSNVKKVIKI